MCRSFILILLLGCTLSAYAQKPMVYRGYIAGRPCELLVQQHQNRELAALCLDHNSRKSFELVGRVAPVSGISYLHVQDTFAHFEHLYLKADKGDGKLRGRFYAKDKQGVLELAPIVEVQYETNRDILAFNTNYTRIYEEMGLPMLRHSLPFGINADCGRFVLNKDEALYLPNGVKVEARRQKVFEGFRSVFKNWAWSTVDAREEEWLHLQMVTYYPVKTMLAVVERRSYQYGQQDTTLKTRYNFVVMANPTNKSWINITNQCLPKGITRKMEDKFPAGRYALELRKLVIDLDNRQSRFEINTPRAMLLLGSRVGEGQQPLYFSWHWKKDHYTFR